MDADLRKWARDADDGDEEAMAKLVAEKARVYLSLVADHDDGDRCSKGECQWLLRTMAGRVPSRTCRCGGTLHAAVFHGREGGEDEDPAPKKAPYYSPPRPVVKFGCVCTRCGSVLEASIET